MGNNILYKDGLVYFKCEKYTRNPESRHQVVCNTFTSDCPYWKIRHPNDRYSMTRYICSGDLKLEWIDYLKFKGIVNEK